jgi:hypothetical protein
MYQNIPENTIKTNYYVYGQKRQGKTYQVKQKKIFGNFFDKCAINKWWDGYEYHQKCILIDELPYASGHIMYHFKQWLDNYSVKGEVKGGHVYVNHNITYITSNHPIELALATLDYKQDIKQPTQEDLEAILARIHHIWKVDNSHFLDKNHDDYYKFIVIE